MRFFAAVFLLLIFAGCGSSDKPQLHLFVWSEYFSQDVINDFEKEFDCHVILDTFDSNEAMYTKLRLGATGYDIVMPSNYIFETMHDQGMLREIRSENISNLKHLNFEELKSFEIDDVSYGVPYLMTYTGLGYVPSRVPDFQGSWRIFSRKELKGRMTMLNDMREALGAALLTLGYSINTKEIKEIDEAVDLLLQWRGNLAKYESEQYKNGLSNLEFLVVQGYNSDMLQVMADNEKISFKWPLEGAVASVDILAILKSAPNPDLAEKFINYCLRPEVAAAIVNASFSTCMVVIPEESLPQDPLVMSILYPSKEVREKAQLIRNIGDYLTIYTQAWERVLTGG